MISQQEREYLKATLRMNPIFESGECLALRRSLLRKDQLNGAYAIDADDRRKQRDSLRDQIQSIQQDFWKLPLDQLEEMIQAMDTANFPELRPIVNRLRKVVESRVEFPKLGQFQGMDMGLFNAFKAIVALPPGEAVRARSQFIRSIQDKKRLKSVQNGVLLIQKEFPKLMELEKDWFTSLSKLTSGSLPASSAGLDSIKIAFASILELPWYTWWIAAMVIKWILVSTMR